MAFRRILSLILTLALLCLAAGCAGSEPMSGNSAVGSYRLSSFTQNGTSAEGDMTLELRADGTGTIVSNGNSQELTWDDKGITVNGVTSTYSQTGNALVIFEGTTVMNFVRTGGSSPSGGASPEAEGVSIVQGEWNTVQWEEYSNSLFSVNIPKGWQVTYTGHDFSDLTILVKHPTLNIGMYYYGCLFIPNNQQTLDLIIAAQGADFTTGALTTPTVEYFFERCMYNVGPSSPDGITYWEVIESTVPDNLAQAQQIAKSGGLNLYDYKVLHTNWTQNGFDGEGMYMTLISDSGMYEFYLLSDTIGVWSGRGEFENWEPVLTQMLGSLNIKATVSGSGNSYSSASGSTGSSDIMSSWEARNKSQDIMSQKQSDATLGYERDYDTQTNEIYRADNGFMEQYDLSGGQRYTSITDDQYTEGYSGYISFD